MILMSMTFTLDKNVNKTRTIHGQLAQILTGPKARINTNNYGAEVHRTPPVRSKYIHVTYIVPDQPSS